jgi:hypothetical protein
MPVDNNVQYVYILGESTAVGVPCNKISYSQIIESIIIKDKKIDNKEIKFIHLELAGCQLALQFLHYSYYRFLHPTHKGIMLLYMGTNNWANKEMYSDFGRNLMLKFGVCQLFREYGIQISHSYKNRADFQYEYERIIKLAKKFGEDIYISTVSVNNEFPPMRENTSVEETEEIDKLYLNKDYNKAKELCIRYLEDEKYEEKSHFWYRLGIILRDENNIKEANDALINAIKCDFYRFQPIFQNEVIRKIAKKYDVPVFDFFKQLYNSGKIIGYNFFTDWIHPNIEKHIDIAYGFIDLLSKKYKFDFIKKEDLNIEELKRTLEFNNNDMADLYMTEIMHMIDFFSIYSTYSTETAVKFNEETYLKWRKALEELEVENSFFHNKENIEKFLKLESEFRKIMNSDNLDNDLKEKELKKYREEIFELYDGSGSK